MANSVFLIGRITKDPEIKQTQNDKSFVRFTIAVPRRYKSSDGKTESDFIGCIAYGKTAELIGKYIRKGQKFLAEGEIRTGQYEKDGRTVYATDVIVNNVEFLEPKGAADRNSSIDEPVGEEIPIDFNSIDDDVPF